jgi:hypothetical protein
MRGTKTHPNHAITPNQGAKHIDEKSMVILGNINMQITNTIE